MQYNAVASGEVIGALYQAAADPAHWPVALSALGQSFGAGFVQLEWMAASGGAPRAVAHWHHDATSTAVPALLAGLRGALHRCGEADAAPVILSWPETTPVATMVAPRQNPAAPGARPRSRRPVGGQTALPMPRLAQDSLHDGLSHGVAERLGHGLAAAIKLPGAEGQAAFLLHRGPAQGGFATLSHTALGEIAGHAQAAMRIAWQLDETRFSLALQDAALDQIGYGVVVANAACRVVYANGRASRLGGPGSYCFKPGFRLAGPTPEATETLHHAVQAVCQPRPAERTLRLPMPAGAPLLVQLRTTLVATISPLAAAPHRPESLALIKLRAPEAGRAVNATALMALFGLTQTEASLLPRLLSGAPAGRIAASRGVSTATIRAQIRHILAKTGAANQRALAAIIAAVDE